MKYNKTIPALSAVGKTAALGAVSGAAGYGGMKAAQHLTRKKPKRKMLKKK